ncbi:MAG TPA: NADP-dependent oxidoreductase, partial [Ktedonobacterales bacterium]|nr:NADP-dependent oxidoreductase [Ktedonobacterales bacterium]
MAQMHAVRLHRYGAAENLIYEETQRPEPQAGEALVRVRAAGVNPVDWQARAGRGATGPLDSSIILGWDIAGVVEEVGGRVDRFAPGEEVFGMVRFPEFGNAYADYVAAPADDLAKKPANISFVEAAAAPLVALTAWQALFEAAQLQPGQSVLIHAAAGGFGHV